MLTCQKARFAIPEGVHYLNCAYLSPLPETVEAAGVAGLRRKRVPVDFPPGSMFTDSDRLRGLFARLIGARDPARVAILPAVSYGIAVAARNVDARSGQNLVIAQDQFPSNVYAWRALARRRGLELRTVERPGGVPCAREWSARIQEAIDRDTAVVALPHVHWTDGARFDLERIGVRARAVGAALVIDGSQSVGALPFDVAGIQPDALVCAGYKWLLGPYSMCLGYFGPRFDGGEPLEETWIARQGSEDFQHLVDYRERYRAGAARYDVGERSNFILVPMQIAALTLLLEWEPGRIQAYCRDLLAGLVAALEASGVPVEEAGWRGEHILGIRLPARVDLGRLERDLRERGIHASLRGDALRISPNVYNSSADIDPLSEVLLAAL
ncbi:MAG: aminotransferase class V-fold PLP-dependent enzyme [Gemmatimonadota bacterium]